MRTLRRASRIFFVLGKRGFCEVGEFGSGGVLALYLPCVTKSYQIFLIPFCYAVQYRSRFVQVSNWDEAKRGITWSTYQCVLVLHLEVPSQAA